MSDVSVITVNFNQPLVTEQLIKSIEQHCLMFPEVIVVDNGSSPDPVPAWRDKYPHICFIRSTVNVGFAGGNNIGIRAAKRPNLFLVNNDTEFTSGLLERLLNTLEKHPSAGAVSPKIKFYSEPDRIQYAGYTPMNYFTIQNATIGLMETDTGQYDNLEQPTAFVHGAAMMIKRSAVEKAGLMPENFFLYYEEMDWCERIRKAGFDLWINTFALIYHKESVSVGRKSALKEFFMNRNRILFARRNSPLVARCFFYLYFCAIVVPRNILAYTKNGNLPFVPILFRSIWWNITHRTDSQELGYSKEMIK